MNNLPARVSANSIRIVAESIVPRLEAAPRGSTLVFSVRIDSEHIVARDFAAFLELIDHTYGRSLKGGFDSYARQNGGHFAFERSQAGSWELIAEQVLGFAGNASPIVVLWLVLKYLPAAILSASSSYNQIEQGRLARQSRKRIREEMKRDQELANLPNDKRAELARLVDAVSHREASLMPRVRRFMKSNLLEVKVYIKQKEEDDS